jgi:hypothetical protein
MVLIDRGLHGGFDRQGPHGGSDRQGQMVLIDRVNCLIDRGSKVGFDRRVYMMFLIDMVYKVVLIDMVQWC